MNSKGVLFRSYNSIPARNVNSDEYRREKAVVEASPGHHYEERRLLALPPEMETHGHHVQRPEPYHLALPPHLVKYEPADQRRLYSIDEYRRLDAR